MPEPAGYEAARDAALKLLTRRRMSVAGLRQRLIERGNDPLVAAAVVERLQFVGLLDDEALAEAYVRDGVNLRGHGRWRLQRELVALGVEADLAAAVLEREYPKDNEATVALELAQRRAERLSGLPVEAARRRLIGFLERRGLGPAAVHQAVDAVLPWRSGEA